MPLGKMRHRINIQTIGRTTDNMGGNATSYSTTVTVWGMVEPVVITGMEALGRQADMMKMDMMNVDGIQMAMIEKDLIVMDLIKMSRWHHIKLCTFPRRHGKV